MFRWLSVGILVMRMASLPLSAQTAMQAPPAPPPPLPAPLPHPVLDRIRAANAIHCGVVKEEEDYSRAEDHGNRAAFDIDLCKAIAVAVLGPAARLIVVSLPDEPSATDALLRGHLDLIATASPDVTNTAHDITFSPVVFFDGQSVLFPNQASVRTTADLVGRKVCFLTGSVAEEGLHRYAELHHLSFIWYPFSEAGEMEAAFFTGNCDAITSDVSQLANIRAIDPRRAHEFTILPEIIRQDPLALASSASDPRFAAIIHWTVSTLVTAEALGVTQSNVGAEASSLQPAVQRLLGERFGSGTALGLRPGWGAEVLGAVGNYGEIFTRDLGADSPLRLDRGENRLPADGGLLFAIEPAIH